jgi:hypothetical protein
MLNKTRKRITQVAAGVGGLSALASIGANGTGNVLWRGLTFAAASYGVCTLIIKYKK